MPLLLDLRPLQGDATPPEPPAPPTAGGNIRRSPMFRPPPTRTTQVSAIFLYTKFGTGGSTFGSRRAEFALFLDAIPLGLASTTVSLRLLSAQLARTQGHTTTRARVTGGVKWSQRDPDEEIVLLAVMSWIQ